MDFTVSALSFVGPKMKWMAQLPKDMGIEIFWEYGSEDYWKLRRYFSGWKYGSNYGTAVQAL